MYKTKIHPNIFIHISKYILLYRITKKEGINISTMKTHQVPNNWQYQTCIKVLFSNQNLQIDIVTPRL